MPRVALCLAADSPIERNPTNGTVVTAHPIARDLYDGVYVVSVTALLDINIVIGPVEPREIVDRYGSIDRTTGGSTSRRSN